MDREVLRQVILDQHQKKLPTDFVERTLDYRIWELEKMKEIVVISGLRRCGKSTLLQKIRQEASESDYFINFDDDRLVNFQIEDFQNLYEVFTTLFGIQNTFYFDEIQNIAGWEHFARRLRDLEKKVYITGSNAEMLSRELGTRLTGRYMPLEMYPFSFYEYTNAKAPELLDKKDLWTTEEKGTLANLFNQYSIRGGIPEYVRSGDPDYLHMLYETIIYRDIITRYKLPQEKPIKELVFYLASHVGKDITFNALRKTLNIGHAATVSEYCHYLENTYLCFFINRYSHSLKKQIHYGKKHYFVDHALAKSVGFRISEDRGRLLENIVFIELKRRGKDIYFHREKKECDFLTRTGAHIDGAYQVCTYMGYEETKKREYDGLLEALEMYSLDEGFILTEDTQYEEEVQKGGKTYHIRVLPVWKWLLQI